MCPNGEDLNGNTSENPKDNILQVVKTLLGIKDDTQDEIIRLHIEIVSRQVLIYCNRSDIPDGLHYEIALMVVDIMDVGKAGKDLSNTPVASVSEAGRTVGFATAAIIQQRTESKIADRKIQLNRFKQPYR